MISLKPFFQPSPHRSVFLFLAAVSSVAFVGTVVLLLIYPAPIFTWQQLQELQLQEIPLYAFERGNLEFTLSGENFILFERWLGNPVKPNLLAQDFYLLFVGLGLAGLLAVISAMPRFWFYTGALVVAFFYSMLRWETLMIFNSESQFVTGAIVVSILGLLTYFQFYGKSGSLGRRLGAFIALHVVLILLVSNASTAAHPLRLLAVNTLPGTILLALVFIIVISSQLMASFVTLAAASSKTQPLRHYFIISAIYLLNLWLAYLNRIGWMEWDYTIPSGLLLLVSTALTVWTIRQRMPLYENLLQSELLLVGFILSMATVSLSVYGFFHATANDIALLSLNDLILYCHLGYGMMFILYVASNFLGVLEKNLPVERILYKPNTMPYFTFRFAGLIATLAFVFYNTWSTHVSHFASAYYTALGDVHYDQPTGKAGTFYRRAHFYAPYNQYACTILADWEGMGQNFSKQLVYSKDANAFQPTEFTILNTDNLHLTSGNGYAEIQVLRHGKNQLPSSGIVRNNLGLAFARAGLPDSAAFYFRESMDDRRSRLTATLNLAAMEAKSRKPINIDSIQQVWSSSPLEVRSNALATATHAGQLLKVTIDLPKDSLFNLFSAALVANYLTNQTNQVDTAFIASAVAMARRPENYSFRHIILPSAAKASYAAGLVNRAFQLMQELTFLGTNPANDNYTMGLMAMDQEKFDVAISYFLYALNHNSAPAALANAVSLAEEGRIDEATIAWDTISKRKDPILNELGESMKRVLAAPASWFEDLSETEKLYYALYRIPLSDSLQFDRLITRIRNEDLRAKAYLNRAREYYRADEVIHAAKQYKHLQGLHLMDTELFAEIKYFEMRLLAAEGRIEELWKLIDQGIIFGPYHQAEKNYYEGLKSWAAGDTAVARRKFEWLATNNWLFDEGVVAAAMYHRANPRLAYRFLSEALQVNGRSVRILKAYIPVALARGFDQYASDALQTLRGLISPVAFQRYIAEYRIPAELIQ